jgi:hypothetical protein
VAEHSEAAEVAPDTLQNTLALVIFAAPESGDPLSLDLRIHYSLPVFTIRSE